MLPVQRALISVFDKRGVVDFARGLVELGVEVLSTGGTHRALSEAGLPVTAVADLTGFPEILGGRVKTLHPSVHGGILADRAQAAHLSELQDHGIRPIDMVVVNLYPFQETAATPGASLEQVVEMIDIGGPTMIRAAAKNFAGATVVVNPDDYPQVLAALQDGERTVPEPLRRGLALKAFRHTQEYDAAIAGWLAARSTEDDALFPRRLNLDLQQEMRPRYGENPHQGAALYRTVGSEIFGGMRQHQGKELSWNNLLDADAARRMVALFEEPAVVIVKHNNPCGAAWGPDLETAYERALASDPLSAYGSIIALNREADGALAKAMANLFVEVVIAPGFDEEARRRYRVKKNLRLVEAPLPGAGGIELRGVDGGFLAQTSDSEPDEPATWTCPTTREPGPEEQRALELAWRVCRGVKSNAIVIANAEQTVGIGAGQMSRVDACKIAIDKAALPLAGSAAASDAFFPFPDGLEALAEAGVTAVVQPGGSKRDGEVIAAADARGVAMLLTGRRHFRH